jgi:hypothetical protein
MGVLLILVRIRMQVGVRAGGEKPPATRFSCFYRLEIYEQPLLHSRQVHHLLFHILFDTNLDELDNFPALKV